MYERFNEPARHNLPIGPPGVPAGPNATSSALGGGEWGHLGATVIKFLKEAHEHAEAGDVEWLKRYG